MFPRYDCCSKVRRGAEGMGILSELVYKSKNNSSDQCFFTM